MVPCNWRVIVMLFSPCIGIYVGHSVSSSYHNTSGMLGGHMC